MQINRKSPTETVAYLTWEFFENKDVEKMLDCFTDDVRWIGAADPEDRLISGKEQLREMYLKTVSGFRASLKAHLSILDELQMEGQKTVVIARIVVQNSESGMVILNMRSDFVCVPVGDEFKVSYMHSSVHYNLEKRERDKIKAKNSRLELNSVVNAIPGGIAVYKLIPPDKVKILYYSDGVPALTGHTREEYDEILKKDSYAAVYKEDYERFLTAISNGIMTGERVDVTYRRVHKDGSLIWTSLMVQAVGLEDGEYTGHAVFTGVPEQFNLQRTILDETTTGIYVVDAQTFEIYYANTTMLKLFHAENRDYNGQVCYKFFFDHDKPCDSCGICTGIKLDGNERHLPQYGKICRVWEKDTNWMQRPAMIRYAHDITEQKLAQEQLLKEQERYRLIVENTGAVIFDWDLEKGAFYTSGNFSKYAVYEQGAEAIINRRISHEMVYPDDLSGLKRFGEETKQGKTFAEVTLRVKMRDGSYRWTVLSSYNVFNEKGKRIRTIGTMRDVDDEQKTIYEKNLNLCRVNTVIEDTEVLYWEYDIVTHRAIEGEISQRVVGLPEVMENYPESIIEMGLLPNEYIESFRKLHAEIEEGSEYAELRIPLRLKDENIHWQRIRYHTLFDEDGKPIRAIGTAVDITEQVEARRQYEELVAMQEMSGQKSYDYLVINLTQNSIISVRSEDKENLGYAGQNYEAFRRESCERIMGEKNKKRYSEDFKRTRLLGDYAAGVREKRLCVGFAVDNGRELWLDMHMSLTKNPADGDIIAFSYGTDVTDQHMAQEVLDAVTSYDFDIVAILNVNTGCITLFKCQESRLSYLKYAIPIPFEESIQSFVDIYVFPEDRELFLGNNNIKKILTELADKDKFEFTFRIVEDTGEIRIKKNRYAYYDRQNGIVLLTRIDVSDVIESQEKLNRELSSALKSAQQANVAKSTFLSAMSHDIRTPMNAIIGMTELAIADRNNQKQVDESLATIKEASAHLLYLINDILEMSRIESGKMVLSQDRFSQKELVDRISQMALPLVKKKKIKLEIHSEIRNDCCYGDSVRLYRVLGNLISNAIKFTPENGGVNLYCQERIIGSSDMSMFRFTVTDTGVGIEEDQLEHIFEPFYRAESAAMSGVEGSGLGLAIVKSILDMMGGSIAVESTIGIGSVFSVEVPLRILQKENNALRAKPTANAAMTSFEGVKILLVEDHPVNAIVATRLLERVGAKVVHAENGKIGYEMFRDSEKNEFDAIIMDLQMPVMNGYEATKAIRGCKHPRAKNVPIIAMTANAYAEDIRKSFLAGMNDHIAKPIEMERLTQVLSELGIYRVELRK